MTSAPTCVDCNDEAPSADDSFTLISSRFGWRLELHVGDDGSRLPVWRCPNCWQKHRGYQRVAPEKTGTK